MQKKYIVRLSDEERRQLKTVIRKLSGTSQKVRRAYILLKLMLMVRRGRMSESLEHFTAERERSKQFDCGWLRTAYHSPRTGRGEQTRRQRNFLTANGKQR